MIFILKSNYSFHSTHYLKIIRERSLSDNFVHKLNESRETPFITAPAGVQMLPRVQPVHPGAVQFFRDECWGYEVTDRGGHSP